MPTQEQILGCLFGLALGDALGARFEGGIIERLLWRVLGTTKDGRTRWTDDTQMTIDLVESFLRQGRIDPDDLAKTFANSYRWSRGYGPGTAKVLRKIARGVDWREANCAVYRGGSYGNGAAMRAPIVGLIFANRFSELPEAASLSAAVTHAHPLAIEGAVLLARTTALTALNGLSLDVLQHAAADCILTPFTSRWEIAQSWLRSRKAVSPRDIRHSLGNGIAAPESCVTAIYLALRFVEEPFLAMQEFVAQIGGDTDTIGAMAASLWGVAQGYAHLPAEPLQTLEQHERLSALAFSLYEHLAHS